MSLHHSQPGAIVPPQFSPPQEGEVINNAGTNYYLGEDIGEGYYGKVYACSDDWMNDLVAKVMVPKNQTYEQVRDLWTRELTNLVNLRHPNITYVYDAFEYRHTFHLIIERCADNLFTLIQWPDIDGNLWLPYLARDILQAIDYIHRSGYVHKDIHAGNVFSQWVRDRMVPKKPPVLIFKVGDLGISRLETDINVFSTILAPWILPPESIDPGTFGTIGKQVDIYHAGLLFLNLFVREVPHFTTQDILAGKPRQLAENLPSPYARAISRALRRHVYYRTQSALELWKDIRVAMPPSVQV